MLTGNIKNIADIYPYLNVSLQKALTYISNTDFTKIPKGEYEIEGRNLFFRVNTYTTEPKEDRRPERHLKYIDVQFLAEGRETVWYTPYRKDCVEIENNAEANDVIFYADAGEKNAVTLSSGDFAIFFPWEIHRPNCSTPEGCTAVKKIVLKVLAE